MPGLGEGRPTRPLRRPRRGSTGPVSCACALGFTVPARCMREGERRGAAQVDSRHAASGVRLAARELPLRESSSKIYARQPRRQHGGQGDAQAGRRYTRRVSPRTCGVSQGHRMRQRCASARGGRRRAVPVTRASAPGVHPGRPARPRGLRSHQRTQDQHRGRRHRWGACGARGSRRTGRPHGKLFPGMGVMEGRVIRRIEAREEGLLEDEGCEQREEQPLTERDNCPCTPASHQGRSSSPLGWAGSRCTTPVPVMEARAVATPPATGAVVRVP
jgi:hypothetical protein